MHLLVRTQERFARGASVDADERWQGPAGVHNDPPVSGVVLGTGDHEEWVGLAPGGEWGLRKGDQHGTL